jgi:hypothetical protein
MNCTLFDRTKSAVSVATSCSLCLSPLVLFQLLIRSKLNLFPQFENMINTQCWCVVCFLVYEQRTENDVEEKLCS